MKIKKIFGPPGTGKTTYLLNAVQQELEEGVSSRRIGYLAFTRKAANEAKTRAIAKFPDLNADTDFPWFRTLHSLAYQSLGIHTSEMMKPENYREFAREAGLDLSIETGEEDFMVKADHPILNEINIARIRAEDLRTHYNRSRVTIEWFHFEYVERAYRQYKEANGLLDFTDLLVRAVEQPDLLPWLEVLIVDEAQDLSRVQWQLVMALAERSQRVLIAGDDDQAVYTWAGADVETFLNTPGEVIILDQSYRVPAEIHEIADRVVGRIRRRQPKAWRPREVKGEVKTYMSFDSVPVNEGEWLIMASTNYMLNDLHSWLKSQGLLFERHGHRSIPENVLTAVLGWEGLRKGKEMPFSVVQQVYKYMSTSMVKRGHKALKGVEQEGMYTLATLQEHHGLLADGPWYDVLTKIGEEKTSYIIALLRRGTKLQSRPMIKLSTIHGAKGGEADHVLLLTDLSTKFAQEYDHNPDAINRLLYVALTRARQSLHIVLPTNEQKGFRI